MDFQSQEIRGFSSIHFVRLASADLGIDSVRSFGYTFSDCGRHSVVVRSIGSSFTQNNADAALASVLDSSIDEASPSTPDLFGSGVVDVVVPAPNTKNSVDDIEEWDSD